MRKCVSLGLAVLIGATGCYNPHAATGWRFEVMKPPTMNGASVVTCGSPPVSLAGFGSGPVSYGGPLPGRMTPVQACAGLAELRPHLEEIHRRLEVLEGKPQPLHLPRQMIRKPGEN